jgi:hypothetical protein
MVWLNFMSERYFVKDAISFFKSNKINNSL